MLVALLLSTAAGCASVSEEPWAGTAVWRRPPHTGIAAAVRHETIGRSGENRPLEIIVLGQGDNVTLVMAGIHGNETAGIPLVRKLADYLQGQPELLRWRRVVILAAANPDGIARGTRVNSRGIDLNRNFPAGNRINSRQYGSRGFSEPESRIIDQLLQKYLPRRIVSIHQPLQCIDYDGPGEALANQMAKYCPLPVRKLGAQPGSLGAYAGETLGIPIITMELPAGVEKMGTQLLWDRYGKALLAAIVYPERVR